MFEYAFSAKERGEWKEYPVRVVGPTLSECHGLPTLVVQSMTGGFVTANCSQCGKKQLLKDIEFENLELWVSCPKCRQRMKTEMFKKNYGYACLSCDLFIKLADVLPSWEDLR